MGNKARLTPPYKRLDRNLRAHTRGQPEQTKTTNDITTSRERRWLRARDKQIQKSYSRHFMGTRSRKITTYYGLNNANLISPRRLVRMETGNLVLLSHRTLSYSVPDA